MPAEKTAISLETRDVDNIGNLKQIVHNVVSPKESVEVYITFKEKCVNRQQFRKTLLSVINSATNNVIHYGFLKKPLLSTMNSVAIIVTLYELCNKQSYPLSFLQQKFYP